MTHAEFGQMVIMGHWGEVRGDHMELNSRGLILEDPGREDERWPR